MRERIHIEDESGDRDYFTMIPNYILNHSSGIDQALYLQMKRFAGERGECFASKHTLMEKLGVGRKSLNKSLKYLLDHNWIKEKGYKMAVTKGGLQKVAIYSIVNIWKLNSQTYKGEAKRTPLAQRGGQKGLKVGLEEHLIRTIEEDKTLSLKRKELLSKFKPDFLKR